MATQGDTKVKQAQGPAGTVGSPSVFPESGPAPPLPEPTPAERQVQAHSEKGGYALAVPVASLGRYPTVIDCPFCGIRSLTTVEATAGSVTHLMALLMCCSCCLGCIPYLMNVFKDVTHWCGNCETAIAVHHRSGEVEVLVHPTTTVNLVPSQVAAAAAVREVGGGGMAAVETGVATSGNPNR